ncbi:hypothetical protein [Paenibacillus tundrae]
MRDDILVEAATDGLRIVVMERRFSERITLKFQSRYLLLDSTTWICLNRQSQHSQRLMDAG